LDKFVYSNSACIVEGRPCKNLQENYLLRIMKNLNYLNIENITAKSDFAEKARTFHINNLQ